MKSSKKILIFLFIVILTYSVWNGRNFLIGPRIEITSPISGEVVSQNPINLSGIAKNVSFISLNGRQIFVDKDGNFREEVLLNPGENTLEIFSKDRFNKEKTKRLQLYNNIISI